MIQAETEFSVNAQTYRSTRRYLLLATFLVLLPIGAVFADGPPLVEGPGLRGMAVAAEDATTSGGLEALSEDAILVGGHGKPVSITSPLGQRVTVKAEGTQAVRILADGTDRLIRADSTTLGTASGTGTGTDGVYTYVITTYMDWIDNGNSESVRYRLIAWNQQVVNVYWTQDHGALVKGSGCYGETTVQPFYDYSAFNKWALYRPGTPTLNSYTSYYSGTNNVWTATNYGQFKRTTTSSFVFIQNGQADICKPF